MLEAFENWLLVTPNELLLGVMAITIGMCVVQVVIDEFL